MSIISDDNFEQLSNMPLQELANAIFSSSGNYVSHSSITPAEQDTCYPLNLNAVENPMIQNNDFNTLYASNFMDRALSEDANNINNKSQSNNT